MIGGMIGGKIGTKEKVLTRHNRRGMLPGYVH